MTKPTRKYFTYDDKVIPTHFPRLLVEVAVEQGADSTALLEGTGIETSMLESPDARISLRQYARLVQNAKRLTRNTALGIDLGRRIQPPNLGMLGLAVMGSPDVGKAIDLALQYYRILMPAWDLSLEVNGDRASLIVREAIPLLDQHVFATELLLFASENLARITLGRATPIIEIRLDYAKPAHAKRYTEVTRAPIRFNQPVTEIVFDATILKEKLRTPDPITVRVAERQCEASLSSTVLSESLVANVRRLLGALPGRYPDRKELARVLQTSERTLRRGLKDMGTSYTVLLDSVRCEHAIQLLIGTDLSINEIAGHLGFSEGRSFRRAFKRWTGWTATQYREDKRAEMGDRKGEK